MDLKERALLREDPDGHWYYRSKAKAVERLLRGISPRHVLDIGAGSGFFSRHLLECCGASEAWCVDSNYAADRDVVENGKNIHFRRSIEQADADVVLLMDVLEHVDDDVGLLKEYVDKVGKQATYLISVPAFQFMWSGHDVFLEHKRRYTLSALERVVQAAGLRVKHGTYFFAGVFPAAMLLRLPAKLLAGDLQPKSNMKTHSRPMNALLYAISSTELKLIPHNRAFGLTAFCVAVWE